MTVKTPRCRSGRHHATQLLSSFTSSLRIRVQRVVERELLLQPFGIRDAEARESLRNRSQAETFRRSVFLPLHIRGANDEAKALECWIGQAEIFENHLERATLSAMIQSDLGQSCRIERCR